MRGEGVKGLRNQTHEATQGEDDIDLQVNICYDPIFSDCSEETHEYDDVIPPRRPLSPLYENLEPAPLPEEEGGSEQPPPTHEYEVL